MLEKDLTPKQIEREEARRDAEELLNLLDAYRKKYEADMIKIYFIDATDYTLKFYNNGEKIKVIRRDNKSDYYNKVTQRYIVERK